MTKRKTQLPSVRADEEAKEKIKLQAKQNEERDRLVRAMRMTFKTPHGMIVLDWLMKECGYNQPILGADAHGDIDEKRTVYGAMRLNLYLKLRKFLTFNILKEVEYHE